MISYLIKDHLEDKQGSQIFQNSTLNNWKYNCYINDLNDNTPVRDRSNNIPRFGIKGR